MSAFPLVSAILKAMKQNNCLTPPALPVTVSSAKDTNKEDDSDSDEEGDSGEEDDSDEGDDSDKEDDSADENGSDEEDDSDEDSEYNCRSCRKDAGLAIRPFYLKVDGRMVCQKYCLECFTRD